MEQNSFSHGNTAKDMYYNTDILMGIYKNISLALNAIRTENERHEELIKISSASSMGNSRQGNYNSIFDVSQKYWMQYKNLKCMMAYYSSHREWCIKSGFSLLHRWINGQHLIKS